MRLTPSTTTAKSQLEQTMHSLSDYVTAWTLVWLLCACAGPVLCDVDKRCPMTPDAQIHNQGICGNQLSDILKLLCGRGGYHKRSLPDPKATVPLNQKHFISKRAASSFLGRVRRSVYSDLVMESSTSFSGIVCECCHHSCTIMELSQYCINPDDNLAMALYNSRYLSKRTDDLQPPDSSQPPQSDSQLHTNRDAVQPDGRDIVKVPKLFPKQKLVNVLGTSSLKSDMQKSLNGH